MSRKTRAKSIERSRQLAEEQRMADKAYQERCALRMRDAEDAVASVPPAIFEAVSSDMVKGKVTPGTQASRSPYRMKVSTLPAV